MAVAPSTLPALEFAIESADAVRFAAAPTVAFTLRITSDKPVRSLALNAQIRIAPARRRYSDRDERRLVELFGPRERWGETLRTFRWAQASVHVPPFDETTSVEVAVPCTYDLEVATAKYFYALDEGDVPLEFLFSGTIFFVDDGTLRTAQIPWDREATYRMPVRAWKQAMDNHFPGSAWLRLRDDVFDRLVVYKSRHALPTWEATVDHLLEGRE
ncbi:MAG TPA: DUF6084 family protein [Gaiellaceae bacterium]|nr:DUF6084 family protein [Gaiellaceae bacterium]